MPPNLPEALLAALRKLGALTDPSDDPAWMTCPVGCCVAEEPEYPGPQPAQSSKGIALRSDGQSQRSRRNALR